MITRVLGSLERRGKKPFVARPECSETQPQPPRSRCDDQCRPTASEFSTTTGQFRSSSAVLEAVGLLLGARVSHSATSHPNDNRHTFIGRATRNVQPAQ